MKKTINVLYFIFIILLYNLGSKTNTFLLTISFSLFTIMIGVFNNLKIEDIISKYHNAKEYYLRDKIYKYSLIYVIAIGIIFGIMVYIMSLLIDIKHLFIVNLVMILSCISITIIRFTSIYLKCIGYKNIGSKLFNIYNINNIILLYITSLIVFKIFDFGDYINLILLYSMYVITSIIWFTIIYYNVLKKKKKHLETRKESKINILKEFKKINIDSIFNVIKGSYIYISIIISYYVIINKYNYTIDEAGIYISDYYFFGIIFIYFIYLIIRKIHNKEFETLKENIINKRNCNIDNYINKVIRFSLYFTTFLMVLSGPISYILFKNNIIFDLVLLLSFYTVFDMIINISIICNKEKSVFIALISGLIIKVLFEIPLIGAMYRMGYNLIFGSTLANILGFCISSIIGIIMIKKKMNLIFLDNFENILNIVYETIIYSLILVLLTLIIDVKTKTLISSLLVILFYLFISFLYFIIRRKVIKK